MQDSHVKAQAGERRPTSSSPQVATLVPPLPTPPTTPSSHADGDGSKARMGSPKQANAHPYSAGSDASLESASLQRARKEYMDSLVPPSSEEMSRIAQTQLLRENEEKRKSRERDKKVRRSMDLARNSLDVQQHDESNRPPRHGGLLGSLSIHRHKKSDSMSDSHSPSHPRHSSSIAAAAIASAFTAGSAPEDGDSVLRHRAATLIQRTYRGYKTRREMKGLGLNADTRWTHAFKELRFREATKPRSGKEDGVPGLAGAEATGEGSGAGGDDAARRSTAARNKWKKVAVIAGRAAADMDDDPTSSSDSDSDSNSSLSASEKRRIAHQKREEAKARRRKDARVMGLQYFLEMVDQKHRYGSNLRTYHEEWKKADTKEPFFYWLDYGEGKNLSMATCPRERLDREQVRYLSREERQYYLVQVDAEGRLCWAKNGARIDTTENWKDSIHGIVPADDPTPAFQPKSTNLNQPRLFPSDSSPSSPSSSSTSSSSTTATSGNPQSSASESTREADRAAKYASPGFTDAKGYKKVTHLSASTIFNSLLRKSVRKNTWIFVADTSFRLYVGIKDSGAFQHSSFVQGSRISAAGLIKIKNGRLTSLSPLSGHYRPPASNFRAFVRSLREEGVDTSRVSISKSYAVLVGLEAYTKTRQRGKRLLQRAARTVDRVVHPEELRRREEAARDKSESAEKERRFLAREEEEANGEDGGGGRAAVRVMQKLKMAPVLPSSQEAEGDVDRGRGEDGEGEGNATVGEGGGGGGRATEEIATAVLATDDTVEKTGEAGEKHKAGTSDGM